MEFHDQAGRDAMMQQSSNRKIPMTSMGDILPMVLSSLDTAGNKTTSNLLQTIYDINRKGAVQLYDITSDRYKRSLHVVFQSDLIVNTCKSIHERPIGACINLLLAEDVKNTSSVLKKITYIAPRVPKPKRLGTRAVRPFIHNMERQFEPFSFDSEIDIPRSIYEKLVEGLVHLDKHAQDQIIVDPKEIYIKTMKESLTQDVNKLLDNSQNQMRIGAVNVHLNYMAANSASVDMLSALNAMGTGGEECCLSTALDIVVQKQLQQWLLSEHEQESAMDNILQVFDQHTSTPTSEGGLTVTVDRGGRALQVGGVVMISGSSSMHIPTLQIQATYSRSMRSFELKSEDYNTDRLMVEPNIAQRVFPKYTMDSRVVVKEHTRKDGPAHDNERPVSPTMSIQGEVTMVKKVLPTGALLVDNISSVYIVSQDQEEMDPLTSTLTHTTQSMWNMMSGYNTSMATANGDFWKSDQMPHICTDTRTPNLYLNPAGRGMQMISSSVLKDSVFNDPYIYSDHFVLCFNTMYKAAMALPESSMTRMLFMKCMQTATSVYRDPHTWHALRRGRADALSSTENCNMIMSELHPYFDALPDTNGLKAYNRMVHGNIPLYIRPATCVLVAGQTLAQTIWGHELYKETKPSVANAMVLAKSINAFFTGMVLIADQSDAHMLYSLKKIKCPTGLSEDDSNMYQANPTSLIQGLCGLPFVFTSAGSLQSGAPYIWNDPVTGLAVKLDVPVVDETKYTQEAIGTRFFYSLTDTGGETSFSYMVRPAFHELMKEIRASNSCFAVKMCAMFCAWIRLTPEGTEFAFNHTRWPLAATVLTFKKDSTKHILVSRPNSIISLADIPTTEIHRQPDQITIQSTAHHRITCDGINTNSVIALHATGSSRTQNFKMRVSSPHSDMKDQINLPEIPGKEAFAGYIKLSGWCKSVDGRKRTQTGKKIISLSGEQVAWLCPPLVPGSAFQRPTNPTGRSSLPRTSETSLVDASVEMHDPSMDNGTGVSTLNPYATLPGGYVFCLHADPNGKVGEISNCTYRTNRSASKAAHFFSPPQLMTIGRAIGRVSLAHKLSYLPCSRRVLGDEQKFPTTIHGDSCNSSMSQWSEATGLAQHEPHASNSLIYDNMISCRQVDSTYASREVAWHNHHYAVPGHTFYAKNKSYANDIVSPT